MINEIPKCYVFRWCNGRAFEDITARAGLKSDPLNPPKPDRYLYVGTQKSRIYLVHDGKKFLCEPYVLKNNSWQKLYAHKMHVRDVTPEAISSEDALREFLSFQMLLQFRNSVEGFYDDPLSAKEILAALPEDATTETLERLRYTYYEADVQRDPEWDGAVDVLSAEGHIYIPYRVGEDGERHLIVKYATFSPYSHAQMFISKVSSGIDHWLSKFGGLRWSEIRSRIEKI